MDLVETRLPMAEKYQYTDDLLDAPLPVDFRAVAQARTLLLFVSGSLGKDSPLSDTE